MASIHDSGNGSWTWQLKEEQETTCPQMLGKDYNLSMKVGHGRSHIVHSIFPQKHGTDKTFSMKAGPCS